MRIRGVPGFKKDLICPGSNADIYHLEQELCTTMFIFA
jgi:hypothetical protein